MKPHEQTIRIGIIGAGANTREKHIPALKTIPGVEIASVANRTRESGERAAKEFAIPKVYDNWLDLISADDTDAILIGTWPNMHAMITMEAFACNKHVLCEARMAMNANEARDMLGASRAHPALIAQLVPSPFTLPFDTAIQQLIADGTLGDILAVELRATAPAFLDRTSPLHWRHDSDLSGYNTLTLGIWYEALMRWIGPATRLLANARVFVKQRPDTEGRLRAITIPEHIDILADMACGAAANMRFSAVTGLCPAAQATLCGSEATLQLDTAAGTLHLGRRGESALQEIVIPENQKGRWQVEQDFIAAIRGQRPVDLTTFDDGLRYMEFTEAAARSAQSGQSINLPF